MIPGELYGSVVRQRVRIGPIAPVDPRSAFGLATARTTVLARGTGVREARTFLGLSVGYEGKPLLVLVEREKARMVAGGERLEELARGITFLLSVDEVKGIVHGGT